MKLTKTQQAFIELAALLEEIKADGVITDVEFQRVMGWRCKWKTVVRREELRDFDDWLNQAMSDGVISSDERMQLVGWSDRLSGKNKNKTLNVENFESGDQYLKCPVSVRPTWRNDPATAKQVAFLIELGDSEEDCRCMTKGQASNRIESLLESRDSRRGGKGGCMVMLLAGIIGFGSIVIWSFA